MITGIIMAAGKSSRMGKNKLLLPWKKGTILENVIEATLDSKLDDIILVYNDSNVGKLADKYNITSCYNPEADRGQSSSIKAGVGKAMRDTTGYLFIVGDQPFLNGKVINRLIDVFVTEKELIVVPVFGGRRGNPVLFSSELTNDLKSLRGDTGGRTLVEQYSNRVKKVYFDSSMPGVDIDTPEEYRKYRRKEY